jgi:hypothetical protein
MRNRVLLDLLANSLFGKTHAFDYEIDWREVYGESVSQTVTAVAFEGILRGAALPKEVACHFLRTYQQIRRRNAENHGWHVYLGGLLEQNGIPYRILKGAASARYYPKPSLRVMGDVDFLVPPEYVARATAVLERNGIRKWEKDVPPHIVFSNEKARFEMHYETVGIPRGKAGELIRGYTEDIFEAADTRESGGYAVPSPFHHGLILLLHTQHHMLSEGVGLRHLCDWAVFVNSFSNEEFSDVFKARLKAAGLWNFARVLSQTAVLYLGLLYRDWMGTADPSLCGALIGDILTNGNFGRKESHHGITGLFIASPEKSARRGGFWQFLYSAKALVEANNAFYKRHKLFLPAGLVYYAARYAARSVLRAVRGKHTRADFITSLKKGSKRNGIYRKLKLFEAE